MLNPVLRLMIISVRTSGRTPRDIHGPHNPRSILGSKPKFYLYP